MEPVKKSTTFHVFLKESFTVQLWDHLQINFIKTVL